MMSYLGRIREQAEDLYGDSEIEGLDSTVSSPPNKHSGLIIGWKDSELTETVIVLFTGYNLLQGEDTG